MFKNPYVVFLHHPVIIVVYNNLIWSSNNYEEEGGGVDSLRMMHSPPHTHTFFGIQSQKKFLDSFVIFLAVFFLSTYLPSPINIPRIFRPNLLPCNTKQQQVDIPSYIWFVQRLSSGPIQKKISIVAVKNSCHFLLLKTFRNTIFSNSSKKK